MKALRIILPLLALIVIATLWIKSNHTPHQLPTFEFQEASQIESMAAITPIPTISVDPQKVDLGRKLFFDKRLSRDNTVSCASCHNLDKGGMDGKRYSVGVGEKIGAINTPTVFNAALNNYQFWDGRAATLEEQVEIVITLPQQMGSDWSIVISKLKTDANYSREFAKIYVDGITKANVATSIAEFERTLLTPNSRFDKFLRGDKNAMSAQEIQGYGTFKAYGCISCHQGVLMGGNMFERMGSIRDYFKERGNIQPADLGHFNVTHDEMHRYYFKVGSLRNIEKTAPYFHDGSANTMEEAVKTMAKYNLGFVMPEQDVNDIVAFFKTLSGEYQGKLL